MTVINTLEAKKIEKNALFKGYNWFCSNVYKKIQSSVDEFFQKDFSLRFMGISIENNVFFFGDEYFVNKIPVVNESGITVKLSSTMVSSLE